ncbi:glycosyltransferase family 2 protein [Microbacter margulisiae]|uniref:Glycosyltransferase involved in cell wall biosynthesis n=1 Tax=Microbacter margulisiae TaxID=1350067 RepID=A0A7W5DSS9_9PORP|nr:glycosyltransferase family A protein [Microbacter margulisiae]MBB3188412.1 glycosyltransferase involved in cell wall biosynthesis [Microbacter margulisiae]
MYRWRDAAATSESILFQTRFALPAMKTSPKISVLMPVYNVATYVQEAIESIINQSYTDFELLIINDGSTDTTRDKVLQFTDSRIRFIENEHNIGLANTLNRGIELAAGEYIARMDGDDISLPDRLKRQVDILDRHPDIDICGAGYRFFGSKNYEVRYPQDHEAIKVGLLFGCCMIIPLFRKKSIVEAHLQYEQEFFPAEDYRFWTKCVMQLKMYNIPETLFLYRMHATQVSETRTNQSQMSDKVRTLYLQKLFPALSQQDTQLFISTFAETKGISAINEVKAYDQCKQRILQANMLHPTLNQKALHQILQQHIVAKIRNFIVEEWFVERYTLNRYISLFSSGILFRLPLKFNIKLWIKVMLHKTAQPIPTSKLK